MAYINCQIKVDDKINTEVNTSCEEVRDNMENRRRRKRSIKNIDIRIDE